MIGAYANACCNELVSPCTKPLFESAHDGTFSAFDRKSDCARFKYDECQGRPPFGIGERRCEGRSVARQLLTHARAATLDSTRGYCHRLPNREPCSPPSFTTTSLLFMSVACCRMTRVGCAWMIWSNTCSGGCYCQRLGLTLLYDLNNILFPFYHLNWTRYCTLNAKRSTHHSIQNQMHAGKNAWTPNDWVMKQKPWPALPKCKTLAWPSPNLTFAPL